MLFPSLSLSLTQMGNEVGKLAVCFTGVGPGNGGARRKRKDMAADKVTSHQLDDLGHSFCYIRPELAGLPSSDELPTTTFKAVSGAAVSANISTPLSTVALDLYSYNSTKRASSFEGSTSFASIPLRPVPRHYAVQFGPLLDSGSAGKGFLSRPIDRAFVSLPLVRGIFSGPLEKGSHDRARSRRASLIRALSKGILRGHDSIVTPVNGVVSIKESNWMMGSGQLNELTVTSLALSNACSLDKDVSSGIQNLQWAQGKAGEDRVHVVVSEDHGWIFVGIYDGFNGPDAPDYLLSNLYYAIDKELKDLLWDENVVSDSTLVSNSCSSVDHSIAIGSDKEDFSDDRTKDCCSTCEELESKTCGNDYMSSSSSSIFRYRKKRRGTRSKYRGVGKKWEENQRRWICEWYRERLELERRLKEQFDKNKSNGMGMINHCDVMKALSRALKKTEEASLELADEMVKENPELALIGSCVLVMLMKGDDVYVMNVGDSRAVLAQTNEPDLWSQDLERINEETVYDLEAFDDDRAYAVPSLAAIQLSMDHSTSIQEEVARIRDEHPDDASVVMNDRVKGSLKVTRAFGAGFLKQMFRIDYVGTSPYINCTPSLHHHRLGPRDRFLILSSDGVYQYFTNEEAVSEVELFVSLSPEGDPAQHLVEELLYRAAKRAGMNFYELLEVPQGERRRYHDDVSIVVVSLEGRIWRSSADIICSSV